MRAAAFLALALVGTGAVDQTARPEPPRDRLETSPVPRAVRHVPVADSASLQRALDSAKAGDWIELQSGATYSGPFRLPRVEGNGWIVLTSSPTRALPMPGTRIGPGHGALMAKLRSSSGPVIATEAGAHHYRLIGLDIAPAPGTWLPALVQFGADETSADALPHDLIVDRSYLHGDPQKGARRGVALNARRAAVVDSYFADFKEAGADSQAIAGWNGPGPFTIQNNYLEAAGENVMFGGADPSIEGLVPSDILVTGNHLAKPLRWRKGTPGAESTEWTVKNLFELKNARRVRVEGNLLEHSWAHAQDGFAVLLTVRTEDDAVPWAVVEDVAIERNVIRRSASGVNIMGIDDGSAQRRGRGRRIAIRNNLFDEIGGPQWGPGSRLFQLLDGSEDVVIEHNTALHAGTIVFGERAPHRGFVLADNIVAHNEYGIIGSGTGVGLATLLRYFPDAVVRRNVIVGGAPSAYPPGNYFPATLAAIGFTSLARGDYRLKRASRYAGEATDGTDVGADLRAVKGVLEHGWQVRRP